MHAISEVNDETAAYFRGLGFTVTWDFRRRDGLRWYEIYDGERMLAQLDFGAPLAEVIAELPGLTGIPCLGGEVINAAAPTWEMRGDMADLQRIASAILEHEAKREPCVS